MDFVEVDDLKRLTVDRVARFMMYRGYKLPIGVLYKGERMSLLYGPRIVKIIEKNRKSLRYLHATYSGDKRFEVRYIHSGHINAVDLVAKTCSCRSWQLSGVPCGHVICSLESRGMSSDLMLYVSDC
ncbi:Uncharacterized protein Adt_02722 [Abeliophyllum distichum]|uniref:SWIM-type domain-containing protein n=1 Tax=Abeliophyllum distichum TaxID=126358 RepID=A0ABD1VWH5_9LAMI